MAIYSSNQNGQGMVGFIVGVTLFVVPVAIGINYISRIGDAKHKSYEAARYSVWERTVWHQSDNRYNRKSDQDIQREITVRVFGEQSRPLDSVADRARVLPEDIIWDNHLYGWEQNGDGRRDPILETPPEDGAEPVVANITDSQAPGSFSNAINSIASVALQLDRNGFYNGQISIQLQRDPNIIDELNAALGDGEPLTSTTNNAMLVGAWNANGPSDVRRTVRRTLPTAFLDSGVMDALLNAASIAGFSELGDLEFGHVDPERIPCQRLRRGGGGLGC